MRKWWSMRSPRFHKPATCLTDQLTFLTFLHLKIEGRNYCAQISIEMHARLGANPAKRFGQKPSGYGGFASRSLWTRKTGREA